MKKDSNKDNLEEFLKQHLGNYEAAENGWNVPPENIWEDVRPLIKETPPVKFKVSGKWFPLLLIGGGMIICVLIQSFLHQKEVDRLSTEINSIKTELSYVSSLVTPDDAEAKRDAEKMQASVPQVFIPFDPGHNKPTKVQASGGSLSTMGNHKTSTTQAGAFTDQAFEPNSLPRSRTANDIGEVEPFQEGRPGSLLKPLDVNSKNDQHPQAVRLLPTIAFSELNYQDTLAATARAVRSRKMAMEGPAVKFSLGPMHADRFLDTIPKQFENYVNHQYKGFSLGFNLEWPIYGRWQLETGINYYHIVAESHHHRHFHYSEAIQDAPGLGPNDFQFQRRFHSAIGHVGTTLVLTQAQPNSTPNEDIDISFDSDTHAQYVGVPLALTYRIRMGRLGFSLRGGLLGNIRVHQKFRIKHLVSDDPNILFKHSESDFHIDDVKRFHLQYLIGAGLDFYISPHYAFHIEPTFNRSLTPLTTMEGVSIGLQTIQIRGGLKLHF